MERTTTTRKPARKPANVTSSELRQAIGYARVSTDDQAESGVSLADQRERIEAYCKAHGYQLARVEVEAESGKRADNRPALQRALAGVCRARGVLVVVKLDRLARSTRDAIDLATQIEACGADLASISEQVDTGTGAGRFVFRLMASLGELERDQISERTRAALAHKRRHGERVGAVPYGYRLSDDGVHLLADDVEQAGIRRMRELREQGLGYARVARVLNGEMIPPRGKSWHAESVRVILARTSEPIPETAAA